MPLVKVSDLTAKEGESDYSSDSDQDELLHAPEPIGNNAPNRTELNNIIAEINNKIAEGEQVDLSEYPPLFVVHYRGVHFFETLFDSADRKLARQSVTTSSASLYAPAVYALANVPLNQPVSSQERRQMHTAAEQLEDGFYKLETEECDDLAWFGNKRSHNNQLLRHYQRYANNYAEFRAEGADKTYSTFQILPTPENPYISTADDPTHALYYALGAKAELSHGKLSPTYLQKQKDKKQNGRAKHPKVGYVQMFFHTVDSLYRNEPLFLSVLQAAKEIDIKDRQLNERETTFKTRIGKKHVVHTEIIRYPSFNRPFNANYHILKYGLFNTGGSYTKLGNALKGESETKTKETSLVDNLAIHYGEKLLQIATKIAADRNGYIVYIGLDGRLSATLPTTADISTVRRQADSQDLLMMFQANMNLYTNPDASDSESDDGYETDDEQENTLVEEDDAALSAEESNEIRLALIDYLMENKFEKFEATLKNAISRGFDINQTGKISGRTLLHYAIINRKKECALILKKQGADESVTSDSGKTAKDYAKEYKVKWYPFGEQENNIEKAALVTAPLARIGKAVS